MRDGTIVHRGTSLAVFPLMLALFFAPLSGFGGIVTLERVTKVTPERVALVVGNAVHEHLGNLRNPENDAADVGAALELLGFDVTRLENAGYAALRQGLDDFGRVAARADAAVVFYAGHAFGAEGRNYLVPVDASVQVKSDPDEAVPLEVAIRAVELAARQGVVIVDAMPGVRVEPACGTLVAWAARPGTVAHDGTGRNSPVHRGVAAAPGGAGAGAWGDVPQGTR